MTIEEVESELKQIPMSADTLFERVRAKQTYFPDYGVNWRDQKPTDSNSIRWAIEGADIDATNGGRQHWVDSKDKVNRLVGLMSWDGFGGGDLVVTRTAYWMLFVDKDEMIIGYSGRFPSREMPTGGQ